MYGTVMRGMPNHQHLAGAAFLRESRTAPLYRLLSVRGEYPLLVRDQAQGHAIDVQVFDVPRSIWRRLVDAEPSGLVEGKVQLEDGCTAGAMLGDMQWIVGRDDVEDITDHGGWRAFVTASGDH